MSVTLETSHADRSPGNYSFSSNPVCEPVTSCADGQVTVAGATLSSDRVCAGFCSAGLIWTRKIVSFSGSVVEFHLNETMASDGPMAVTLAGAGGGSAQNHYARRSGASEA